MVQQSFLPEIDRKKTQRAVEDALEKYRIYKFMSFEEREASVTASYEEKLGGASNTISDQTASLAIYNVDGKKYRQDYCTRVERVVNRLPRLESFLITERYMTIEHDYITDQNIYNHVFQPPISEPKYSKIRWRAFYKLALELQLIVEKETD